MKAIHRAFAATAIFSLSLTLSACADTSVPEPTEATPFSSSAVVSASASPTVSMSSPAQSRSTLDQFYSAIANDTFHLSDENLSQLEKINSTYDPDQPQQYIGAVIALVPSFSKVGLPGDDPTFPAAYINNYLSDVLPFLEKDTTGKYKGAQYSLDESKIQLSKNGDEAQVPLDAISGTYQGQKFNVPSGEESHAVKEKGQWRIDPLPSAARDNS